jgi:hypothetical protein
MRLMDAFAAAIGTAALALLSKVFYDFWSRWREQRGIAAALAGELRAHLSFVKPDMPEHFRQTTKVERSVRMSRFRALPKPTAGFPVFDKIADKIGLLTPQEAAGVSAMYSLITAFRTHTGNLSSESFLASDDAYHTVILTILADMIDDNLPKAKELLEQLDKTANQGFLEFLAFQRDQICGRFRSASQ